MLDGDGAVEVEDAEGVLQQLDEALDSGIISETELTHTLKNTFKINEKVSIIQWQLELKRVLLQSCNLCFRLY